MIVCMLMNACTATKYFFFFFNDTATTEIYTLSLHDALPISISSPIALWTRSSTTGSAGRIAWSPSPTWSGCFGPFLTAWGSGGGGAAPGGRTTSRRAAKCARSEERRVGGEGRTRWAPDHLKKKKSVCAVFGVCASDRAGLSSDPLVTRNDKETTTLCGGGDGSVQGVPGLRADRQRWVLCGALQ